MWLIAKLKVLADADKLPGQLKQHVEQLRATLEQRRDYSLVVKIQKETVATFAQEKLLADGAMDSADSKDLSGSVAIELKGVFDAPVRMNTRIELIFDKV